MRRMVVVRHAINYIPTTRDTNNRDVNENIHANVAFTLEANYSLWRYTVKHGFVYIFIANRFAINAHLQ